ncbi:MAG: DMT family transporter [Hyphomicrobiales bacterium]|nr:DMT family transporter [Hyphomicrobiales bacterium]
MSRPPDTNSKSPSPTSSFARLFLNPFLLLALAGLSWAGNHIAGRAGAGHVPPLSMGSLRWLIGAALLWPFVYPHIRKDWPLIKRHAGIMLVLCVGGGAMFSGLQYMALQHTSAMNASIFNSFAPIIIAVAGFALYGERLRRLQILGIVISLSGVILLISRGDMSVLRTLTINFGDLLLACSMTIWGIYSALLRDRPKIHPLTFTFALALTAGVCLLPGLIWEHSSGFSFQLTWLTFWVMAYVSIFPSVIGYLCWNRGIEAVGPARGGIFLHLVPIYGVILAILLLGEQLQWFHLAGFVLIISGVWLTSRKQTR